MAMVRQDVMAQGGDWGNKTLLNYALAMKELDALPIEDPNSWKFMAAMHGFHNGYWMQLKVLPPGTKAPKALTDNTYGNQCQHGSWYFLPWHRAYLFAFEAIVAAKVKQLTGDEWALPYWNYLDDTAGAQNIPRAFLEDTLPDGTPNPLQTYPREPGITALEAPFEDGFSLKEMGEHNFGVGKSNQIGFGGGITGDFVQFANWTGKLESNPHNTVHGMVGGLMGNAITAALDPLFWLHHCNIDRLWEAWRLTKGNTMVKDPRWLNGPADRKFIMPSVGGGAGIQFTAAATLTDGKFYRGYDDLTKGTGVKPEVGTVGQVPMGAPDQQTVEPIGANDAPVTIGGTAARTQVRLDPAASQQGVAAMGATVPGNEVTRLYVSLESVRGSAPCPRLDVYVNLPEGASPDAHPDLRAARLTLFGLNVASSTELGHGGNGLGYTIDITDIAKKLADGGSFDAEQLKVTLVPVSQVSDIEPITVERVAVLKRTGKVG